MQIVNATTGKMGFTVVGPKYFLHKDIGVGEIAICIAIDYNNIKPSVWLIGPVEDIIDYICVARSKGALSSDDAQCLLNSVSVVEKNMPKHPMSRLACALSITPKELMDAMNLAKVNINGNV